MTVRYVGTLDDGTEFDSNKSATFWIGKGMLIQGWDEGIPGMRIGGIRNLTIPPSLGYGSTAKGKIPAYSTLHFAVPSAPLSSGVSIRTDARASPAMIRLRVGNRHGSGFVPRGNSVTNAPFPVCTMRANKSRFAAGYTMSAPQPSTAMVRPRRPVRRCVPRRQSPPLPRKSLSTHSWRTHPQTAPPACPHRARNVGSRQWRYRTYPREAVRPARRASEACCSAAYRYRGTDSPETSRRDTGARRSPCVSPFREVSGPTVRFALRKDGRPVYRSMRQTATSIPKHRKTGRASGHRPPSPAEREAGVREVPPVRFGDRRKNPGSADRPRMPTAQSGRRQRSSAPLPCPLSLFPARSPTTRP
ncbi:MAG: FKBP-type peptidyl-prolyl cis-trans isomerase [Fibrella sp.]|nr:FKBP-type peptidyl-prolyl cis-trans isomerase [Armatimonadota bacterium]